MKKKRDRQGYVTSLAQARSLLRQQAQTLAGEPRLHAQEQTEAQLSASLLDTLDELRVHQVELEMQNEELRRAQAQVETAKERYFDLYDLAPVGYCTLSVRGLILQANLTASNLLGVVRSELLRQPFSRFIPRDDQDSFNRLRKQLIASGEPQACELRMLKATGEPFWVRLEASTTQDDKGAPALRVVLSDFSARKQAEQALQESYRALRSVLDTTLDGFWRVDREGRLLEVNPAYCQQSGYSREELLNMRVADLEALESPAQVTRHIHSLLQLGHGQFESMHRRKDGTRWHVEVSVTYCDIAEEQFFVFLRDISARKQAEESLQLAASVFSHSREGIMITAADGTIIDVNQAFTRITGYSRGEAIGQTPHLLSSGRQSAEFYADMWRSLHEKGHWYGELWNQRKNGEIFAVMETISSVQDAESNVVQFVALFSDITELKAHQSELEHIAHFDALSGLPNRVLLADRLAQAITQAQRRGRLLEVVYLDLDGFKSINDKHGHDTGDQVLVALAANMRQALRECDTLARIGGDEFVAVLVDLDNLAASVPMLNRLLEAASLPVRVGELQLQVSASMGVTFYPQDEEVDAEQLLSQADQAMYQAKLAGKHRLHFFDIEHDRSVRGHHESLAGIRQALANQEFVLHYQPKVNLRTGEVLGAEALIRWQHPQRGLLLPAVFLPVIEDHPLAIELGEWVIASALSQVKRWQDSGLELQVSVNLGARQLQQQNLFERLLALLATQPQVKPSRLVLEVLETSALEDVAHVSRMIEACREIGVSFALDDFGTGYSSLSYLKRLPVAELKIDQSFVRDMLDDPDDLSILRGVVGLAGAFHLQVVAEGVESVEHGAMLLQMGCELAQGYGIAYPMAADELVHWARTWWTRSEWHTLPQISRDELPVLFASVEHRAWIKAMQSYLKGESAGPPSLGLQQSHFGRWLTGEGLARHGSQPAFLAVEALHREVEALAQELCRLQAQGRHRQALARLAELQALQETLLEQLKTLVLQPQPRFSLGG